MQDLHSWHCIICIICMFLNVRLSNTPSYFGQFEFKTEEEENIIIIIFAKRLVTLGSLGTRGDRLAHWSAQSPRSRPLPGCQEPTRRATVSPKKDTSLSHSYLLEQVFADFSQIPDYNFCPNWLFPLEGIVGKKKHTFDVLFTFEEPPFHDCPYHDLLLYHLSVVQLEWIKRVGMLLDLPNETDLPSDERGPRYLRHFYIYRLHTCFGSFNYMHREINGQLVCQCCPILKMNKFFDWLKPIWFRPCSKWHTRHCPSPTIKTSLMAQICALI